MLSFIVTTLVFSGRISPPVKVTREEEGENPAVNVIAEILNVEMLSVSEKLKIAMPVLRSKLMN